MDESTILAFFWKKNRRSWAGRSSVGGCLYQSGVGASSILSRKIWKLVNLENIDVNIIFSFRGIIFNQQFWKISECLNQFLNYGMLFSMSYLETNANYSSEMIGPRTNLPFRTKMVAMILYSIVHVLIGQEVQEKLTTCWRKAVALF